MRPAVVFLCALLMGGCAADMVRFTWFGSFSSGRPAQQRCGRALLPAASAPAVQQSARRRQPRCVDLVALAARPWNVSSHRTSHTFSHPIHLPHTQSPMGGMGGMNNSTMSGRRLAQSNSAGSGALNGNGIAGTSGGNGNTNGGSTSSPGGSNSAGSGAVNGCVCWLHTTDRHSGHRWL